MLVSEYATEVINTRPYKYQTRQTFFKDLKRLGIWDLEIEKVNSALIRDVVEQLTTQSTRKRLYITARSIFRDRGICQDLPNLEAEGKIYDIPPQEQLEWLIEKSKYRLQLLLCMFGGLRVGEACAVTPEKLSGLLLLIPLWKLRIRGKPIAPGCFSFIVSIIPCPCNQGKSDLGASPSSQN